MKKRYSVKVFYRFQRELFLRTEWVYDLAARSDSEAWRAAIALVQMKYPEARFANVHDVYLIRPSLED